MKSPSERGVIGAWAFQARSEADLSVEQVAERVGERGQAVSPATIRGIESGNKQPSARLLRLMGVVLGSIPPGQAAPGTEPPPDLATALVGLTRELEAWRLERQTMQDQIEELQATVAAHDLRLGSAPSGGGTGSQEAPDALPDSAQ